MLSKNVHVNDKVREGGMSRTPTGIWELFQNAHTWRYFWPYTNSSGVRILLKKGFAFITIQPSAAKPFTKKKKVGIQKFLFRVSHIYNFN